MRREKEYKYQGLTFYERRRGIDFGILREAGFYVLSTVIAVFLALFLVVFFGFRVSVIGSSMETTLSDGDTVIVNRLSPRLGLLKRGDVIAFYPGGNTEAHPYIKRIAAVPGDTVEIRSGVLYVNGTADTSGDYDLMENAGEAASEIQLGSDEYFVLGDQRNDSEDSRSASIGNVTEDMIIGTVWLDDPKDGNIHFVK